MNSKSIPHHFKTRLFYSNDLLNKKMFLIYLKHILKYQFQYLQLKIIKFFINYYFFQQIQFLI